MSVLVRWLILALVLVAVGAAWWLLTGDPTRGAEPRSGAADTRSGAALVAPAGQPLPADSRAAPVRDAVREPLADATPLVLPPSQPAARYDAADPVGLLVYGAVYDPDGRPLDGEKYVVLLREDGERRSARLEHGSYAAPGLSPGRWTLTAGDQGCLPYEQALELLPEVPMLRVDVHLQRALTLCVKVLDPSGAPLWDTLPGDAWSRPRFGVLATPDAPPGSVQPTGSRLVDRNAHGTWISRLELWGDRQVAAGCDGMLDLKSALPLWVNLLHRHVVLDSQLVPAGAGEVVFVLRPEQVEGTFGSVRVQVVDAASGAPVEGARVELSDFQSSGVGKLVDAQGVVHSEHLPPGLLDMMVSADGYEHVWNTVLLGPGEHKDLGRLPLDAAASIRGRVVDSQGNPRSMGISYVRADWWHDPVAQQPRISAKSSAEGDFSIGSLGRARYSVWILDREGGLGCRPVFVDTTAGDVEGVTLVVDAMSEVVFRTSWPAVQSHEVTLLDASGFALWRSFLDGEQTFKRRYPPGEYTALVAGATAPVRFTLAAGTTDVALAGP